MPVFSLSNDGVINLWQILMLAGVLGIVTIFIPWLIGVQFRLVGKCPLSFFDRVMTCLECCIATIFLLPLCFTLILSPLLNYRILRDESFCQGVLTKSFSVKCAIAIFVVIVGGAGAVLLPIVHKMRCGCVSAVATSNLRSVAKGLELYQKEYGCFPDDIRLLADAKYVGVSSLYSPTSDKFPPTEITFPYRGPIGFNCIPLTGDAPDDLILLWDDPENCENSGAYVLYKGGEVKTVPVENLPGELSRAYEWLISRRSAASQPTTMP